MAPPAALHAAGAHAAASPAVPRQPRCRMRSRVLVASRAQLEEASLPSSSWQVPKRDPLPLPPVQDSVLQVCGPCPDCRCDPCPAPGPASAPPHPTHLARFCARSRA